MSLQKITTFLFDEKNPVFFLEIKKIQLQRIYNDEKMPLFMDLIFKIVIKWI